MRRDEFGEVPVAGQQQGQTRRGATGATGEGDDVAGARSGAEERWPSVEFAEHGDRDDHLTRLHEIASHDSGADLLCSFPDARRDAVEHGDGSLGRTTEADDEGRGACADRGDIGSVLGDQSNRK